MGHVSGRLALTGCLGIFPCSWDFGVFICRTWTLNGPTEQFVKIWLYLADLPLDCNRTSSKRLVSPPWRSWACPAGTTPRGWVAVCTTFGFRARTFPPPRLPLTDHPHPSPPLIDRSQGEHSPPGEAAPLHPRFHGWWSEWSRRRSPSCRRRCTSTWWSHATVRPVDLQPAGHGMAVSKEGAGGAPPRFGW